MTPKIFTTVALATLAAAPTALSAQVAAPAPADAPVDSAAAAQIQGWLAEIQQINGRLQELQQRAMQDPELAAEQEALGARIRTAMEAADPELQPSLERVEALQSEAVAAEQQADTARLMEIGEELRQIESRFMTAQEQALAQPEISSDLDAFQVALQSRLVELDPEAPQLIARFQELQQMLASALRPGG
jgi:chromosome segregation ATPase